MAGRGDIIEILATRSDLDVNVTANWHDHFTALHLSAVQGHDDAVRALLAAPGIDLNAPNASGNTPIMELALTTYLRTEKHSCIFRRLMNVPGVDLKVRSPDGRGLLSICAAIGSLPLVDDLLSKFGADVNERGAQIKARA